jgi:hypothetical protein
MICILFGLFSLNGLCKTDANIPYKGISIYIDYPDAPALVKSDQLDSLLNGVLYQEVGVERTFRKYWYEQTRRNIDIHQDVFFYTAPLPSTYYDTIGWQKGILLWKDALEWVITNNPTYNWSSLNRDGNDGLLSVMIISSKWGPAGVGGGHWPNWTLSNGVKVTRIYGSVLKAPWDTATNIFMTLHESGHGIFLFPDTYDTEYNSGGTSFYTLMSGGKNDVEPIGGPFSVQQNWGYIIEPGPGTHTITLKADGDSVVVLRNLHDSLEFFTIEARKQSTRGNSLFPVDLGLLIWHSDTKVSTSNTLQDRTPLKHYAHSIEQADGLYELEADINIGGNKGDIYLPGNSFNDSSAPNTKWWDNSISGIDINNIKLIGTDKISITVTVPNPHTDHYPEISQTGWKLVSAPTSQLGYEATNAFDGDINTYYHIPWGNNFPRPHEIVIDLGKAYSINEFYYNANKNNVPPYEGRIEDYKVYISEDAENWGVEVASGKFFLTGIKQYVLFANKTGRYLKLSAETSFNNDVRTSIAEINLRGFDPASQNISNNILDGGYKIYPNPATELLNIDMSNITETTVELYNLEGELLLTKAVNESTTLNVEELSRDIYIVIMKRPGVINVFKFIKI